MNANLTPDSLALFTELASSAGDWDGAPLFEGTQAQKGNLTDLKVAGLVRTERDSGCTWVYFLPEGVAFARSLGIDCRSWPQGGAS